MIGVVDVDNKPQTLYRGIKIDYNKLKEFMFDGVDLVVNYEPIIDKYGRKTVSDGNEYGVYMTDNLDMVTYAYGDLHHDGISIHNNLTINNERVLIPDVGVIYKIDTTGLDIRKPFISEQLKGHYNNGFQGEEWITDKVPAHNYSLYRVRIGSDILDDAEDVEIMDPKNLNKEVFEKVEQRKTRLETFADAMEKVPQTKRNTYYRDELNILKDIYGKNGFKYIDADKINTTDAKGMLRYLEASNFHNNEDEVDFKSMKYIVDMQDKVTDVYSIINTIMADKVTNEKEKKAFIEREVKDGGNYFTDSYDNWEIKLDKILQDTLIRMQEDLGAEKLRQMENNATNLPQETGRNR